MRWDFIFRRRKTSISSAPVIDIPKDWWDEKVAECDRLLDMLDKVAVTLEPFAPFDTHQGEMCSPVELAVAARDLLESDRTIIAQLNHDQQDLINQLEVERQSRIKAVRAARPSRAKKAEPGGE